MFLHVHEATKTRHFIYSSPTCRSVPICLEQWPLFDCLGTNKTQVTYEDVNPMGKQFISPGGANDPLAVFDGSVIPSGIDGKPTLMYSGVKHLPITWSIEYIALSETQSVAVSYDGGRNFTKMDWEPVIVRKYHSSPLLLRICCVLEMFQNAMIEAP